MKRRRMISLLLTAPLLCGAVVSGASAKSSVTEKNVALGQMITATSSYVPAEGFYDVSFLVDGEWETYANGNVKLGWNTNPYAVLNETDPVDITISFDREYAIDRIVLKPMKWGGGDSFPRDYELQISADGANFKTVASDKNVSAHADSNTDVKPVTYTIDPVSAKYFRLHITRHSSVVDNTGSYTSSIGEIEVYGAATEPAQSEYKLNKPALVMNPNEKDRLKLTPDTDHELSFESSDETVVKVGKDGVAESVADGEAKITVTDKTTGLKYECAVTVRTYKASDHFQIVAFMPYFNGKDVNETTFDNLKKGGITNVELNFALAADAITYENNLKALQYAYERGLDVTVSEREFNGNGWQNLSDARILEFVERYSHLPGVAAYFVVDEPASSTQFARGISIIKSVMPSAVAHMNYCGAYADNVTALQKELQNKYGLSLDYVMYDAYVFMSNTCNENTLYNQLRYNQTVSRKLGVPGACYIQAMNWNNNHRPNADEIRYQVYAALAGGVKQISYFCWKTPAANAAETYGPAVIDINNEPTDLFEPVCEINAQVQALGPTLMKLDTKTMYHTGVNFGSEYTPLPLGFFIQPTDPDQKLTVSHMTEKETGRNYAMIVNRDYKSAATVSFTAMAEAGKIEYISSKTGEAAEFKAKDGVYSVELKPGEGVLIRTAEDFDFVLKDITDFRALKKAVDEAEALDLSLYREDGKDDFTKALETAKTVLEDEGAKQSKVDSAKENLVIAQSKLKPRSLRGVNLALNKKVAAENSYEEGTYFSRNYMTDGYNVPLEENTHAGWSVDPYSRIKRTDPVDVTVDLEEPYVINTVVIKPCVYNNGGLFPCDYELQISEDGKSWTTAQTVKDAAGADGDRTTTVDRIVGRYVRVHITKHSETPDATGGYLSQIGELEIYGTNIGETEAETEESEVTEQPTEKATEPAEQPVTEPGTEKPESAPADTETTAPTEAEADTAGKKETENRQSPFRYLFAAGILCLAAASLITVFRRSGKNKKNKR